MSFSAPRTLVSTMKPTTALLLSVFLTLACKVNVISSQSGNEIGNYSSIANVFEILDMADLQNIIGDLQKDGRLVELVSTAVSKNLNINRKCAEDVGFAVTSTDMWAVKSKIFWFGTHSFQF